MGCNCKVNEHISKIHKNYGSKINLSWKEKISFRTIESFKYLIIILLCIIFLPLVILFYIIYGIKNKGVFNINKILFFLLKYKNE